MTGDVSELSTYSEMFHARPHLQAAELAEYSVKISLLEEAKRSKEEEAESWHSKVMKHLLPKDVVHSRALKEVPLRAQPTWRSAWMNLPLLFTPGCRSGGESGEDEGGAAERQES